MKPVMLEPCFWSLFSFKASIMHICSEARHRGSDLDHPTACPISVGRCSWMTTVGHGHISPYHERVSISMTAFSISPPYGGVYPKQKWSLRLIDAMAPGNLDGGPKMASAASPLHWTTTAHRLLGGVKSHRHEPLCPAWGPSRLDIGGRTIQFTVRLRQLLLRAPGK